MWTRTVLQYETRGPLTYVEAGLLQSSHEVSCARSMALWLSWRLKQIHRPDVVPQGLQRGRGKRVKNIAVELLFWIFLYIYIICLVVRSALRLPTHWEHTRPRYWILHHISPLQDLASCASAFHFLQAISLSLSLFLSLSLSISYLSLSLSSSSLSLSLSLSPHSSIRVTPVWNLCATHTIQLCMC